MTDPLNDELASTSGYPKEMDLDEEGIDLDDVVPDLNPPNSATGGMFDYLAGIGGVSGQRTPIKPFANLQTGKSSSFSSKPLTWQGHSGQISSSFLASSRLPNLNLPSQNAPAPSADLAKVKVAPSVTTDSGYGSVTHETPKLSRTSGYGSVTHDTPKPPQKLQAERVFREPLDIVIERRLIELPPFQGHEDATNSQTLYTDQDVMDASKTRRYILEFVNHLYSHLQKPFADDKISSLIGSLRKLLEAFALKLGQTSQVQIKRDAMYFIYTHRDQITQSMKALFNESRSIDESDMGFGEEVDETDIESFLAAVTKDPAFKWLVVKLQGLLTSTNINSDAMRSISDLIIRRLPQSQGISRHHPSKPFKVTFRVDCDILGFIKEQEYYEPAAEVIPKVITLTGSSDDVQATTCEQYLLQTWPTVGCNLLQAIQGALREYNASEPLRDSCQCKFEDRTKIKVSIGERSMKVEAIGTIHCIAEIGEQIGWFATAFRSSFEDLVITFCHPEIISFQAENNPDLRSEKLEKAFTCRMLVAVDEIQVNNSVKGSSYFRGQCWQQMFNNPVIVMGYPIKPRGDIESGTGLELPFEMMTTLSDARYLTTFDEKTLLKGFSTVLLPVKQQGNLIIWHLLADESGDRISYRDPRIQQGMLVSSDNFMSTRHILGWCSDAQNHIGSRFADYDIKYSGLSQGKGTLSWEKVELSVGAGNYFKISSAFVRGKKERMGSMGMPDGYVSRVQHIGNQYIVLYDVKKERAWLSDGMPVLLHLVRTSLRRDEKEDPDGLDVKHIKTFKEASPSVYGTRAARAVLFNEENRLISLQLKDTKIIEQSIERTINGNTTRELIITREKTYIRLENRVEEICHHLEQVIDENAKAINEGILKHAPRSVLGGFDFVSVAARENLRLLTKKMSISEYGTGWTDLLDSIGAITLFGNDFGELITPLQFLTEGSCSSCGYKASLPSERSLLAVGVDVLEKIIEKGSKDTIPWRLIDDIYWHFNEAAFGHCQRIRTFRQPRGICSGDRTQILTSNHNSNSNNNRHHPSLKALVPIYAPISGAVIFGHGRKRGVTLMGRKVEVDNDSSPEDIIQSQTPPGVPIPPSAQNENSETSENLLSDLLNSDAPNTSTSSGIDGSQLTNTHQVSGTEDYTTPDASMLSETPLSGLDIVGPQHGAVSDVMSTIPGISGATAQNAPGASLIPHRRRPVEKLKDAYTRACKKLKRHT